MNNSPWARPAALTLACALSLTPLTGCADHADAKPSRAAASPTGSAEPEAEPLSARKLTQLALVDGDLPGYDVVEPGKRQVFTGSWDEVKVDDEGCKPLVQVNSGSAAPGDPVAEVLRVALQIPAFEPKDGGAPQDGNAALRVEATSIDLASYEGDGAHRAMKKVADAVRGCAGGFSVTMPGRKPQSYSAVTPQKAVASDGADEVVAFSLSGKGPAKDSPTTSSVYCQVMRHGSYLALYVTLNPAKTADGTPYRLDGAVVAIQSRKAADWLSRHGAGTGAATGPGADPAR